MNFRRVLRITSRWSDIDLKMGIRIRPEVLTLRLDASCVLRPVAGPSLYKKMSKAEIVFCALSAVAFMSAALWADYMHDPQYPLHRGSMAQLGMIIRMAYAEVRMRPYSVVRLLHVFFVDLLIVTEFVLYTLWACLMFLLLPFTLVAICLYHVCVEAFIFMFRFQCVC